MHSESMSDYIRSYKAEAMAAMEAISEGAIVTLIGQTIANAKSARLKARSREAHTKRLAQAIVGACWCGQHPSMSIAVSDSKSGVAARD